MPLDPAPGIFEGFCPIEPVPKGRPRFNSRTRTTYTPPETAKYEKAVRAFFEHEYGKREPMDGALLARYEFIVSRPTSAPKKKVYDDRKPDIDNLVKAFQDAMDFKHKSPEGVALGVIANDSRIAIVQSSKRYAREGEACGTKFSIEEVGRTVIVLGEGLSDAMVALADPCYPKIPASMLGTAHPWKSAERVYIFLGDMSDEATTDLVDAVKRDMPNLAKIVII